MQPGKPDVCIEVGARAPWRGDGAGGGGLRPLAECVLACFAMSLGWAQQIFTKYILIYRIERNQDTC